MNSAQPLRLGFAGTPHFAVPSLDALQRVHPISAVFTQPDRPAGRGQTLKASPVKLRAEECGIPVFQPPSFKAPVPQQLLRELNLDFLVVVAYGLLLPPEALQAPRFGCINIHASLLPRWRGAAPIQRALLAGDAQTGISIMCMDEGLDTGPTVAMQAIAITDMDTAKTLHDRLAALGADLIGPALTQLAAGRGHATPQPAQRATYATKIDKSEALIDWREDAESLSRKVRAFNPWPIAETRLAGAQLRIWNAEVRPFSPPVPVCSAPGTVLTASDDGIDVACGSGALRIHRLQLAGRKPLTAREFIQGQRLDGVRFADA